MTEPNISGIPHVKKTFPIKKIQGKDLTVDVYYVDSETSSPQPAILYFHGGFLVRKQFARSFSNINRPQISGDSNALPNWLIQAAIRRKWTLISANYRCIPESTASELSEDLLSAYSYVSNDLSAALNKPSLVEPSKIIIAGHSGGGYCAVKATLEVLKSPDLRKPAATVSVYGMFDFLAPKWSVEGIDISSLSDDDAEAGRKDLERRMNSKEISFGEKFADSEAEMVHHTRWNLMRYILKKPVYVDYFSGVSGLGKKIASVHPVEQSSYEKTMQELVPIQTRHLFVVDFENLKSDMPPLLVVHGLADTAVPHEDSDKLVEKTKALGVSTRYWRLEGLDHEFDFGFPDLEIAETKIGKEDELGVEAIRELLQELDKVVGT
jgi:acetyl esterase/lipase